MHYVLHFSYTDGKNRATVVNARSRADAKIARTNILGAALFASFTMNEVLQNN
jgi:hypothetical protein